MYNAPNAALLIDFDNVTMGIRSDLTKELRNLLNSEIIKGKVAVQRAYADWRRYPQYIVPLAEASVDLIFAPAYGSSKKNATDIRLAIDALELVFTRAEIGTFILLSGDSDFSSLVLKLKEYGKYVIGVGIRESASDLLVQNCDEYYSYSALTGLTRAGDEGSLVKMDPWELVERATAQMAEANDVMRSDRLKQVMLQLDPSFNEGELGFTKFNKFVQEAANRELLVLHKMENGQFEVGPAGSSLAEQRVEQAARAEREPRRERGRRGGRDRDRDRDREAPRPAVEPVRSVETPALALPAAATEAAAPVSDNGRTAPAATPERARVEEPAREQTREPVREPRFAASAPAAPAATDASVARGELVAGGDPNKDIQRAYALVRKVLTDLGGSMTQGVRDSDIKRRMLEIEPDWDESNYGFSKFSRFLRQAHDAEIINLRKNDNGIFELLIPEGGGKRPSVNAYETLVPSTTSARPARDDDRGSRERGGRDRGRGRGGSAARDTAPTEIAASSTPPAGEATAPVAAPTERPAERPSTSRAPEPPAQASAAAPVSTSPSTSQQPLRPSGLSFRRGSRGFGAGAAPPPLLPGQAISAREQSDPHKAAQAAQAALAAREEATVVAEVTTAVTMPAEPEAALSSAPEEQQPERSGRTRGKRGGRGRGGSKTRSAAAHPDEQIDAIEDSAPAEKPARGRKTAAQAATAPASGDVARDLQLPTDAEGVATYLVHRYKGVGKKTADSLIEAVGAQNVFNTLQQEPERVREVLGARSGDKLLEAWSDDLRGRTKAGASRAAKSAKAVEAPAEKPAARAAGARKGTGRKATRRGGRKKS